MKRVKTMMGVAAFAVVSGLSGCATDQTTSTGADVPPHNHMRDSKGMWVEPTKAGAAKPVDGTNSKP